MSALKECEIHHETRGDLDILRLNGAMDAYSFPRLEASLNGLRAGQRSRIILDCGGLTFINSAALGALIGHARRAREQGGDLKLSSLSPKISGIVELLGFDRILQTFASAKLAEESFSHR
jgi:anti-sigma B factor antagonist